MDTCVGKGDEVCRAVFLKKIPAGYRCYLKEPGYNSPDDNDAATGLELSCLEKSQLFKHKELMWFSVWFFDAQFNDAVENTEKFVGFDIQMCYTA